MTSFTSRYGNPAQEYVGARLWVHERHGCTVLAVSGHVDGTNVAEIINCARRAAAATATLVLDLSAVSACTPNAVRLLRAVDEDCAQRGGRWALVPSDAVLQRLRGRDGSLAVPLADSVAHAEHQFDAAVTARRRMLLPLLGRTA